MSWNRNSNGSRYFEYSTFVGGMAKLRTLISKNLSESVGGQYWLTFVFRHHNLS